jgi:ferredoxin--NADP+ reductase
LAESVFPWINTEAATSEGPRLSFRFLTSPAVIEPGAGGRIERLRAMENMLVRQGEDTKARATGKECVLPFDTLIFAIGDVADPAVGLPYGKNEYLTNPETSETDRAAYEVLDPATGRGAEGLYVLGWARKASEGLVGKARFDAEHGCDHVLKYLAPVAQRGTPSAAEILQELEGQSNLIVTKQGVEGLLQVEAQKAEALGLPEFKYSTDLEMLEAIQAGATAGVAA